MSSERPKTGEWISQPRFDRDYENAGFDHDFGVMWGPHRNQRVSLRIASGQPRGILYVYDPMWNEYNVLDGSASIDETRRALDAVVSSAGYRGIGVDALAAQLQREQLRALHDASLEPTNVRDLGIDL